MKNRVYSVNNIKALLENHSRRAFDLGLVWGTSGNMSIRADADSFFITATGKSLGDITGKIEVVPYRHAGSIELAKKCEEGAKKADVLLLENHGVVAFGPSIEDAVNKTLTLEFLCRLTVLSKAAGLELKEIRPRQASEFLKLLGTGKSA